MRIRFAKSADAKALARIHQECGKKQPDSFMHQLGLLFLKTYYKIFIEEKHSIILVSEREDGAIVGFHSGTLLAEQHYRSLKDHKLILACACIPLLFTSPYLIKGIYKRYKSSQDSTSKLTVKTGPRGEYWAWLNGEPAEESLRLHHTWHGIMKDLGVRYVYSEVNLNHKRVHRAIAALGAEVVDEVVTLDGKKRAIVRYDLVLLSNKYESINPETSAVRV